MRGMSTILSNDNIRCPNCDVLFDKRCISAHIRSRKHISALIRDEEKILHPIMGRVVVFTFPERVLHDIYFPNMFNYERLLKGFKKQLRTRNVINAADDGPSSSSSAIDLDNFSPPSEHLSQIGMPKEAIVTIIDFMNFYWPGIVARIRSALKRHGSLKVEFIITVHLKKYNPDLGEDDYTRCSYYSVVETIYQVTNTDNLMWTIAGQLTRNWLDDTTTLSGWSLVGFVDANLKLSGFKPMYNVRNGPSMIGGLWIKLPSVIENKKAVINPRTKDEYCFRDAICAKLYGRNRRFKRDPSRMASILNNLYDWRGISFPININDISIFEKNNNASVVVFGLECSSKDDYRIYPIRVSTNYKAAAPDKCFDLLYLRDEDNTSSNNNNNGVGHYAYITNLSLLIGSQINKHCRRKYICRACFDHYYTRANLEKHKTLCPILNNCDKNGLVSSYEMPELDEFDNKPVVKFEYKNMKQREYVPYVIYCDLECILEPDDDRHDEGGGEFLCRICCQDTIAEQNVHHIGNGDDSSSRKPHPHLFRTHTHKVSSWGYLVVSRNPADPQCNYTYQSYRGEDAIRHLWKSISAQIMKIGQLYGKTTKMTPNSIVQRGFSKKNKAVRLACHICSEPIPMGEAVLDHCHLTGECRGPACSTCNLQYRLPTFVPIVFHGGSGYDMKFLLREVSDLHSNNADEKRVDYPDGFSGSHTATGKQKKRCRTNVMLFGTSSENFISFSKRFDLGRGRYIHARFIDSSRFLSSSLAKLAASLSTNNFAHTTRKFSNPAHFDLVRRKGVFPYMYMTDMEKYAEHGLPPREKFNSPLSMGGPIDAQEYEFARRMFAEFHCQTLGDYSDLYQSVDVHLLADVFETFRVNVSSTFELDPCWYFSLPGLAWHAALKMTKVEIELITEREMFVFFESMVRGGFVFVNTRHVVANHPALPNYSAEKARQEGGDEYIFFIDANALYGYAMCKPLPIGEYQWLTLDECEQFAADNGKRILELGEDENYGYVFEVDLHYPEGVHNAHNDYPLCPEHLVVQHFVEGEMIAGGGGGGGGGEAKLIATLHNKRNYVVHYGYLKFALQEGLQLEKIHRGVRFLQQAYLKPFVELNTKLRQEASDNFSRNLQKLFVNATFGKTMENVRKRRKFKLTDDESVIMKYVSKSSFVSRTVINAETNLTLIELKQTTVKLDRPLQVGAVILDVAKSVVANFHYRVIKPMIEAEEGGRASLIYGDNDSLCYKILLPTTSGDGNKNLYDHVLPKHIQHFDFSTYHREHPLYSVVNEKVPGKFSDEAAGRHISEFVGLVPKVYTYKIEGPSDGESNQVDYVKKMTGIKNTVVQKQITFDEYLDSLHRTTSKYVIQHLFRSYNLSVHTIEQAKVALSTAYDKRYIYSDDNKLTMAWGNYAIKNKSDIVLCEKCKYLNIYHK